MDQVLLPFLSSSSEAETQEILEKLMQNHVEPVIQQAILRRMRLSPGRSGAQSPEQNVEDVLADARLSVLRALRQMKERRDPPPIRNFRAYVRTVADQAWDQQLRRMFPQRRRLRNQIRYMLSHHPDFGLWETSDGELVGGIAAWKGRSPVDRPEAFASAIPDSGRKGTERLVYSLRRAFQDSGAPVEIEALVNTLEKSMGIQDSGTLEDPGDPEVLERLPEPGDTAHQRLEHRIFLRRLWNEIMLLPVRQRAAILLGLRDSSGHPLAPLLPVLDVAGAGEIAGVLCLSQEEFTRVWNQLPMDDRSIASLLQVTQQQVINLRKCARQRLGRRMNPRQSHGNVSNKSSSLDNKGESH